MSARYALSVQSAALRALRLRAPLRGIRQFSLPPEKHTRSDVTGRPTRDGEELVRELSDDELAEELVVAAVARDGGRIDRFNALLDERDRRGGARSRAQ